MLFKTESHQQPHTHCNLKDSKDFSELIFPFSDKCLKTKEGGIKCIMFFYRMVIQQVI